MRLKVCLVAASVAALALGAFAGGHDDKSKAKTTSGHGHSSAAPEMTAEQKAMMDAWMKAMTPGEGHKMLDGMVGDFDATVSMWEAPGTAPTVEKGVAESRWVMGGRYIESKFNSSMMGMPFQGLGYTGYDNVKKQYWSTWMDNTSTGLMLATGDTHDGGKTWTWSGAATDPMGRTMIMDQKMVINSKDKHTWELWGPAPDGTKFKMMEIEYRRKKS